MVNIMAEYGEHPVYRVFVEKKPPYAVEANGVLADIRTSLRIPGVESVRLINRYDLQGISEENLKQAIPTVLSEPSVDQVWGDFCQEALMPPLSGQERSFAVEYLPGQFDQRADSCAQCIQLLVQGERPLVRNARLYILKGKITDEEFQRIKKYLINPVESREASMEPFQTLETPYEKKTSVETLAGFIALDRAGLEGFIKDRGLAMDLDDIAFCQTYFRDTEHRDPTITEIRMIDTYWSDHCRHTTFLTNIDSLEIVDPFIQKTYEEYLDARKELHREDKPITLMDLAVIAGRQLKARGILTDLDESEEINACTVKVKAEVDGKQEDWLLLFKNETHNHPTEIEPFGGAATCLGGAIRDPLSGRAYVYQAMRVTGAANPLVPVEDTIPGKLPQRKIVTGAAAGYSSYGNQIGLATGQVCEVYHEGYAAKRMEIGAVLGAAPAENVIRETPEPGDAVVLLGGRTGRDGCGGATGSSKSHTLSSMETCGAEVQKGNAPEERKLQRLFRNPKATRMIKRCNDFGAGGVSVAIGELADGLSIRLDAVPKKYDGLDGTELAISESQERMACVIRSADLAAFADLAAEENIEATHVADVTGDARLTMDWEGNRIVDLSRAFLNSNGAPKHTAARIPAASVHPVHQHELNGKGIMEHLCELNLCSQKGLSERFDSTIGTGTVLMPFGGENQLTPTQAMVAKLPVQQGETSDCSVMAWGFNPELSTQSPYHGAVYAVVESVAKAVAAGGSRKHCWLTFQEYFERTQGDPLRWGKPAAALLGAYRAQLGLGIASIGGKDSMSGTFEQIDVPPTLCSFAVSMTKAERAVSQEFKRHGNPVALLLPEYDQNGLPDFESVKAVFDQVEGLIASGAVNACWALTSGGVIEAVCKMAFGNQIGMKFDEDLGAELLFNPVYGGFVLELDKKKAKAKNLRIIGTTVSKYVIALPDLELLNLSAVQERWERVLEPVYPCRTAHTASAPKVITSRSGRLPFGSSRKRASVTAAKPRVLIPVFPGTNCEDDSARAFRRAGAEADIFVVRNLTGAMIEESAAEFAKRIGQAQMIMLPGGFSGGDEPDGSAKFITSFFRNPRIREAVMSLLKERDGLMLGICNGFQALIKLGLVLTGEITEPGEDAPTLTFNTIGRHQSMMVDTRISSCKSPWLANTSAGQIYTVPVSHGEGRFVCSQKWMDQLIENGQVATQYVDQSGQPTYDVRYNPNESVMAGEGITSPDGRIFGKMAHSERTGPHICKNVPGEKDMMIFRSGVEYFR